VPIEEHEKPKDGIIRLVYTPTPHRGLSILAKVFDNLCSKYDNLELDVFSSFALYGWTERDKEFESLYRFLLDHPKANYYGTVSNLEVREALKRAHIFAYPSIWTETSCLCLMEAMSAGLACVHSNLGALYETAGNLTAMYQFHEDLSQHAGMFERMMDVVIGEINKPELQSSLEVQKSYTKTFYDIDGAAKRWIYMLMGLINEPRTNPTQKEVYRTESMIPHFDYAER
jgi:UDP-glucose:(glucosyl)LPS alpha-1,2-glucosyltransferase